MSPVPLPRASTGIHVVEFLFSFHSLFLKKNLSSFSAMSAPAPAHYNVTQAELLAHVGEE